MAFIQEPNIRQSTLKMYAGYLRNHFQTLAPKKIKAINIVTLDRFVRAKQKDGMHVLTCGKS